MRDYVGVLDKAIDKIVASGDWHMDCDVVDLAAGECHRKRRSLGSFLS